MSEMGFDKQQMSDDYETFADSLEYHMRWDGDAHRLIEIWRNNAAKLRTELADEATRQQPKEQTDGK